MKNTLPMSMVIALLIGCGSGSARDTSEASSSHSLATAGAEADAPAPGSTIHVTRDGRSEALAHGYAVPMTDGSTLLALSTVPLDCGYLAFNGMGNPSPADPGDYDIFYTRALPWAAGEHVDIQLLGIAVTDGAMGGASADHASVTVLSAPSEPGARGRVRVHADADPSFAFVPSLDGELDVEVCGGG